jgi:hypothetical protein
MNCSEGTGAKAAPVLTTTRKRPRRWASACAGFARMTRRTQPSTRVRREGVLLIFEKCD